MIQSLELIEDILSFLLNITISSLLYFGVISFSLVVCSVTIDVTPFEYKKSNKSYKILIEIKIYTKGLIAYD